MAQNSLLLIRGPKVQVLDEEPQLKALTKNVGAFLYHVTEKFIADTLEIFQETGVPSKHHGAGYLPAGLCLWLRCPCVATDRGPSMMYAGNLRCE